MSSLPSLLFRAYDALSPLQQSLLLLAPALLAIWLYTALMASTTFPNLHSAHILLLTAHPDDEAMFFSPALLSLTHPSRANTVKLLCLSTGNADGIGARREKELRASAASLGIAPAHVVCLDDPGLQDSPTATWDPAHIASVLSSFLLPPDRQLSLPAATIFGSGAPPKRPAPAAADAAPPPLATDILLTFDAHGVSGHPNHIACHAGARAFAAALAAAHPGWRVPLAVYTLTSVSLLRKYAWILDVPVSVVASLGAVLAGGVAGAAVRGKRRAETLEQRRARPSWLLMVSGWRGWRRGQRAMYAMHRSQMRWFRWGWIGVGRYMVVNDLRRVF